MSVTVDTNVLVRALVRDDDNQLAAARKELIVAREVVITTTVLCELSWVLMRAYKWPATQVAAAFEHLANTGNVTISDRDCYEVGLAVLKAGGDFADGVIAQSGAAAGGKTYLTFDKKAAKLVNAAGLETRLLH